jgi:mannitol/fructose-specific phosphotransferase system IIA component
MLGEIRQLIKYGFVQIKKGFKFRAYILINALADKTNEHISMILRVSIFEDNVRMAMSLSKQKSLYDVSVFSEACACENYKLVVG